GDLDGTPVVADFVTEAQVVESDGKIVLVGHRTTPTGADQSVVERLNVDGSTDTNFGAGGEVDGPVNGDSAYFAVLLQGNEILAAGTQNGALSVARFGANGAPDTSFGVNGVFQANGLLTAGGGDFAYGLAFQGNNIIVSCAHF